MICKYLQRIQLGHLAIIDVICTFFHTSFLICVYLSMLREEHILAEIEHEVHTLRAKPSFFSRLL